MITKNYNYELNIKTITSDNESGLINAINNNFINVKKINCFYHYKSNIIKNANY